MTTTTTPTSGAPLQRYKIGYYSDDWGQRSSAPGGIPDESGPWVRYADHVAALAAGQATAAQQPGVAYAALPDGVATLCEYGGDVFTAAQMRAFADATCALRAESLAAAYREELDKLSQRNYELRLASHGQASAQATPAYKDSTPELHIGDSAFESWYSTYSPAHKSDKQRASDAYAAGMGEPLVTAAPAAVAGPSEAVAYLDIGTGGYLDIGTDLTDEALSRLPKGRHALVIAGTYGIDGYIAAPTTQPAPQQEVQEPHGWLYDWTHSSATGKPDATYTAFTPDEAHARKHDNCRAVYTAPQPSPAPQQEAQDPCPTCAALARTVMLDQVSFDRKPNCYGIRQITDDEGVEEWEDIRTSPDVAREEANYMMATGRGEIFEVVPLWTTPQPSPTAQAAESVPAVGRGQERIAFKDAHRHLELDEVLDAWARPMFKHSHVEASWLGWIARAARAPADSVLEDAARYRWLREGNDAKHSAAWHVAVNLYGCEWDAAIDAARAAQEGK